MSLLDMGLSLEGLPQETITQIDNSLPAFQRLAAAWKEAEPHVTILAPQIAALIPIYAKAHPDIVAVTPLVQALLAFIKNKETSS